MTDKDLIRAVEGGNWTLLSPADRERLKRGIEAARQAEAANFEPDPESPPPYGSWFWYVVLPWIVLAIGWALLIFI